MRKLLSFIFCFFLLSLVGCELQKRELAKICPSPADINQVIEKIENSSPVPFRSNGTSHLIYTDDKGKERKERMDVKIWVNPPFDIYMQGDVAFDPKGVILGANKEEFWLALRPKEIDSFYSGQWDDVEDGVVSVSAGILLESLGVINFENHGDWRMASGEKFTLLAKCDKAGTIIKSIVIHNCDQTIRRINYFDNKGMVAASAEIGDYQQVGDDSAVPHSIKIINTVGSKFELTTKLGSVKKMQFSERQNEIMFNPPDISDYKNIYRVIGDKLVELER